MYSSSQKALFQTTEPAFSKVDFASKGSAI